MTAARVSLCLLLSLIGAAGASAAEVSALGISVPFYDERGQLTHTVTAKRGVARGERQKLEQVEIIYHGVGPEVVQRVRANEATLDRQRNTLSGEGLVSVETATSQLSGEGFDFALATSLLAIRRKFRLANPDVVLTSDRAVVTLAVEKSGERLKFHDVQRCEAREHLHLVFSASGRKKSQCDEAFTDLAIYDGRSQTITMPNPVRALRNGAESQIRQGVDIDLKK